MQVRPVKEIKDERELNLLKKTLQKSTAGSRERDRNIAGEADAAGGEIDLEASEMSIRAGCMKLEQ